MNISNILNNIDNNINIDKNNDLLLKLKFYITYSGRIEEIYLVLDKIHQLIKETSKDSYCIDCKITCCTNTLSLPVSFIEWRTIQRYINEVLDETIVEQIKNNLKTIDLDNKKFLKCPLLVNNECSVKPYRPINCRTYGFFIENKTNLRSCSLEKIRFSSSIGNNSNTKLFQIEDIKKQLEKLNKGKETKDLVVWLKEYFN